MRASCHVPMDRFLGLQSGRCIQCQSEACERVTISLTSSAVRSRFSINSQALLKCSAERVSWLGWCGFWSDLKSFLPPPLDFGFSDSRLAGFSFFRFIDGLLT